jgi:hypothetical protein
MQMKIWMNHFAVIHSLDQLIAMLKAMLIAKLAVKKLILQPIFAGAGAPIYWPASHLCLVENNELNS